MDEASRAESTLLARLVAGDDSALTRAYERYGAHVYGLARRVTGNEQFARDVTQDVFAHLWEHPDRVDLRRGTLLAYLGVVTHRRSVDAVRSATRRRAREERAAHRAGRPVGDGGETEVVEAGAATWRAGRLRSMIETLSEEQREALRLAYYDGCSMRDIADRLGIPEGTAKSRLRLAIAKLRTLLEAQPLEAWR